MYAIYQTIASDLILSLNIFQGVLKRGSLLFGSKYNQMMSKLFINSERRRDFICTYRDIDYVLPAFCSLSIILPVTYSKVVHVLRHPNISSIS